MLFLRDSLLGGSTVDEAEISQNQAQFVPLHQRFPLLLTVRQKHGGIMTTDNMWTCRIIQLSSPHSTQALSPAMFFVCVCLLQIKEVEGIKGPEMALFAAGPA